MENDPIGQVTAILRHDYPGIDVDRLDDEAFCKLYAEYRIWHKVKALNEKTVIHNAMAEVINELYGERSHTMDT